MQTDIKKLAPSNGFVDAHQVMMRAASGLLCSHLMTSAASGVEMDVNAETGISGHPTFPERAAPDENTGGINERA